MFGKYRNKPILITGIVLTVFPLILLKYINPFDALAAGLGISFFTLQGISFLVDSYKGNADSNISFLDYAIYMSFFPTISSGPIKRTDEFASELNKKRAFDYDRVRSGLIKMGIGYVYKLILADGLARAVSFVFDYKETLPSGAQILFATILFGFQLFFDFAGYSDMALGIGKALGFTFNENFDRPYRAASLTEFWRRWHMSLTSWFKEYVYIPLGGSRKGALRRDLNIMIVWALTGLWHGAGWNYVLWGLWFGVLLILEKRFLLNKKGYEKIPAILRRLLTYAAVLAGWSIFMGGDSALYLSLLGKNGTGDPAVLQKVLCMLPLLILCAGISFLPSPKAEWLRKKSVRKAGFLCAALIFVLSLCFLCAKGYSPFVYFKF